MILLADKISLKRSCAKRKHDEKKPNEGWRGDEKTPEKKATISPFKNKDASCS